MKGHTQMKGHTHVTFAAKLSDGKTTFETTGINKNIACLQSSERNYYSFL